MKKNFILMLALSLLVFTSCSKDDDEEGNPKGKQVSKMTTIEIVIEEESHTSLFEYDEKGRITKKTDYEIDNSEDISSVHRYTYGDDVITHKYERKNENDYITTYHLKDGLITHSIEEVGNWNEDIVYTYNDKKELIKDVKNGNDTSNYIWKDGNITSDNDNMCNRTYIYSTIEEKNQTYLFDPILYVDDILYAQGYFGARNKNLVVNQKYEHGTNIHEYKHEYELDKEGYIIEERRYSTYHSSDGAMRLHETNTYEYK